MDPGLRDVYKRQLLFFPNQNPLFHFLPVQRQDKQNPLKTWLMPYKLILHPLSLIHIFMGIVGIYLLWLVIKALRVYINSHEVREEKKATRKSVSYTHLFFILAASAMPAAAETPWPRLPVLI